MVFGAYAGRLLVADAPAKSDVILVLAGDSNDVRYWRGLELLRGGYGREMLVDVPADASFYGETVVDALQHFIPQSAGELAGRVHPCPIRAESTLDEARDVRACLAHSPADAPARSVLIVTSNFHTRRAFSIFRHALPEYRWSVAQANDTTFGVRWWTKRQWAKTTVTEWQRWLWWQVVERWIARWT